MPTLWSRRQLIASEWSAAVTVDGVGPTTVTMPAGDYYVDASSAAESLRATLDAQLEAAFAGEDFTVAYNTSTGLYTIQCDTLAGTWTWTWNQTAFRDAFGFTGGWAASAVSSQVAPNPAQYVIRTSSSRQAYGGVEREKTQGDVDGESGAAAHVGTSAVRRFGNWEHGFERFNFQASPWESGTFDDADTTVPWAWHDFWEHHSRTGQPFRWFSSDAPGVGSQEDTYQLRGVQDFRPQRVEEASNRYWSVPLRVRRFVALT